MKENKALLDDANRFVRHLQNHMAVHKIQTRRPSVERQAKELTLAQTEDKKNEIEQRKNVKRKIIQNSRITEGYKRAIKYSNANQPLKLLRPFVLI